ncbi:MAG: Fe-S cluster assembly protein NifU [Elusimicrobia bacterium GWA2_56_46]|nr:MAG: Fe-S cluster assembly protein NifU [Elusimicrobia bacterium GWA2_56_46]OGR55940.1 MAG: Fe-S cluster assembly protein NifU [Elusimicrobia bacterium GWC2_56_31]HBB67899.1 Fe-S cluster assembly protein NifU [Elusimicrobiota bacterium]HBW22122.1 Fe-S cluster assembly protein NifU [Elusimicrobiota bacterium]
MWNYTEKVYEHFKNPRNVGEIENPDAVGEVGSLICGDALKLTLRIDKATQKILDAKFKTFGCASAIASSSALTEMAKGKTLDEATRITNAEIAEYLGGLPSEKMHCSVMGMEALEAAIKNYRGGKAEKVIVGMGERVVCKCFSVTEGKILRSIRDNGLKTVEEVTNFTKAGGGCRQCVGEIEKILKDYWARAEHKTFARMTVVEKVKMVEKVLAEEVNPKLKLDGGWIELVDLEGDKVKVRFLGMCSGCPSSASTLKNVVEKELKEKIDPALIIEAQ